MITIICALDRRRGIGFEGGLLFHLRADLRRFKALTTGHTVIMGRRTFDSLPKGALPNRRNIVLSHSADLACPGAEVFHSLDEALRSCATTEEVYIIGGFSVYRDALPLADRLALTEVDAEAPQVDTYFPEFSAGEWELVQREPHPADEQNDHPYAFADYVRRRV